ncbi:DUF3047 domain-containing protein [Marinomonas sp. 2405UD68-3]|uniref:DUF3047 domain-containing protein n=1 Tax=Marinomonas sp. 2405UD68-3 TaxID=3391835 RepID=UPI0039C9EDE0
MKKIIIFLTSFFCVVFSSSSFSKEMKFAAKDMNSWSVRYFLDKTYYSVITPDSITFKDIPQSGALFAKSSASASALFYKEKIDLEDTPWLSWSWRVETFPTVENERSKKGDDFASRVHILFNKGTVFSTKGISYVWSQQAEKGDVWENPFAGKKAYMISVESSKNVGVWKNVQRNMKQDLKEMFGEDIRYLSAIAIMTDADNSGTQSEALYSNIRLTKNKYVFPN